MIRWGAVIALLLGGWNVAWGMGGGASIESLKFPLVRKSITDGKISLPFVVYRPPIYDSKSTFPLIVALHGSDEAGTDNIAQTAVGIGPAVLANPERFPALVLLPQIPKGAEWTDPAISALVMKSILETQKEFAVDTSRIYLTGYSIGGFGAFKLAAEFPQVFAAVLPLCGGGEPEMAEALSETPIWIFHGLLDFTVPVDESRKMVAALERVHNPYLLYTEYDYDFHAIWDYTYANPTVILWMFNQRRIPDPL